MNTIRSERSADLTRVLIAIVVFGLFLAVAESYRQGFYIGNGWPVNSFLFPPENHFADLLIPLAGIKGGNPINQLLYTGYPPFLSVAALPYTLFSLDAAVVLLVLPLITVLAVFIYRQFDFLSRIERCWTTAALSTLSYPVLFLIDRANTEAWVIIAIAAFLMAFLSNRRTLAAVALGVAIALKGVPIILLLMFLTRRQWREAAIAVGTTAVLTLIGLMVFGFETISELQQTLSIYYRDFALGDTGLPLGSSAFGAIKWLGYELFNWNAGSVRSAASTWTVVAPLLGVGLAIFLWRKRANLPLWQELTLLLSATILLTHVSTDYKLVVLLLPVAMFVREAANDPARWFYVILFGLLLIPKNYQPVHNLATFQVVLNPLLLAILCATIILRSRASTSVPLSTEAP